MASWHDVVAAEPEFADRVRRTFAVRKHATLATLTRDGSPCISATEVRFDDDAGEINLGMMPGSLKALDLRRDPRLAQHCPTVDTPDDDRARGSATARSPERPSRSLTRRASTKRTASGSKSRRSCSRPLPRPS
jgi:Pyridoxamine 5'-phosphate oxidase